MFWLFIKENNTSVQSRVSIHITQRSLFFNLLFAASIGHFQFPFSVLTRTDPIRFITYLVR